MLRGTTLGLALFVASLPQTAMAAPDKPACDLHILATPSQWRLANIDIYDVSSAQAAFDVQLVNEGADACRVHLSLDTDGAPYGLGRTSGKRVSYSIIETGTGSDLTPRNGRSGLNTHRTVVIAPHSESLTRFDVLVAPEFETDGIFSQLMSLRASDQMTGAIVAEKAITLSAEVTASATMSMSGDFTRLGGMADVDLGEIRQGDTQIPLILHIKSTRAYRLRSSSENGGKLVLPGTGWSIPYLLIVNGVSANPANGSYTSALGDFRRVDNLKLGFAITGSDDVAAGRYSDIVTLEIALN